MSQKSALYSVTSGLRGCYMPDAHFGAHAFTTRAELAEAIRDYLEMMEFPASAFAQVRIRSLWRFVQRHGSSVAHFSIVHGAHEIAFRGLTSSEYNAEENQQ